MKKYIFITAACIFGMLSIQKAYAYSFSAVNSDGQTIYYNIISSTEPRTVEVTYATTSYNSYSGSISIPASVTNGAKTYSVTSIGTAAFRGTGSSSSLTSVTIPNSVISIGGSAFYDCRGLTSITIPNSVTNIGNQAFYSCTGLTSINVNASNSFYSSVNGVLFNNSQDTLLQYPSGKTGDYTIPNSVISIGNYAFFNCPSLTSVTIPNSVTSIEGYNFYSCKSLASVTIGNSVISIGNYAFIYCTGLTEIYVKAQTPPSVGTNAFNNVTKSIPVHVPCSKAATYNNWGGFTNIIADVLSYNINAESSIPQIGTVNITQIPNCTDSLAIIEAISDYPFLQWSDGNTDNPRTFKLTQDTAFTAEFYLYSFSAVHNGKKIYYNITSPIEPMTAEVTYGVLYNTPDYTGDIAIPDAASIGGNTYLVTAIGENAFAQCNNLTSITLPHSVTDIGERAFSYCTKLASVTFGNSVTTIGNEAFQSCTGLSSVTLPNSLTSIGDHAFFNCYNLLSITLSDSLTSIGDYAFAQCTKLASVTIPNLVTTIGDYAFNLCSGLTSLTIGNSVTTIGDYAFNQCTKLTSVTIPNSVTDIGNYAFNGCNQLTSAIIGNSVTSIGNNAFNSCDQLTSLTIGNSVMAIGNYAFQNCSALTSVIIPNSVTDIGDYAFAYCSKLTSLTIGNSVTNIGERAFRDCSKLASVIIPNSVTDIGDYAFAQCSGLTSVTIGNSVTDIGDAAFFYCTGLTVMYVKALTPPSVENNTFQSIQGIIPIYVPCGTAQTYKDAPGWSIRASQITDDYLPYDITVQNRNPLMGTAAITKTPDCSDSSATIQATANAGYQFVQWNDGNTDTLRTLKLTQDTSFTASFKIRSVIVETPGGIDTTGMNIIAWLTPENYHNGVWINRITTQGTVGDFTQPNGWTTKTPPATTTGNFHPSVMFRPDGTTASTNTAPNRLMSENMIGIGTGEAFTTIIVYKNITHPAYGYRNILNYAGNAGYMGTYNLTYFSSGKDTLRTCWGSPDMGSGKPAEADAMVLGTVPDGTMQLVTVDNSNVATANGVKWYLGGTYRSGAKPAKASSANTSYTGDPDRHKIVMGGSHLNLSAAGGYSFTGDIQELIMIKRNKTTYPLMETAMSDELDRVHRYLAFKYGITLPTLDYLASYGATSVWDRAAGYNSHVFGIMHDDGYGLYQKQAQSASLPVFSAYVGNELYLLNSNNVSGQLENGVYAMFGGNNATFDSTVTLTTELQIPGSSKMINYRKGLIYRTQLTSASSLKVKLKFNLDMGAMPEYALISKDPTFPYGGTQIIPITGSGAVSAVELELTDVESWYITMGGHRTVNTEGPGGVNEHIQLWLRADDAASLTTTLMPSNIGRLLNYPDAPAGVQVPAVIKWKDTDPSRNHIYTNTGALGLNHALDKDRLWPVYQPSNYMTNYHPAIRFWGSDDNGTYLGNDTGVWTTEFATDRKHSAFFVVNNNFGSNEWIYPMMFTYYGFGGVAQTAGSIGYGGPGYGVQKVGTAPNEKMVGRFRTWDGGSANNGIDYGKGATAGTIDLFKPGATSILSYHHSLPPNTRPDPTGYGSVYFRFNGLEDHSDSARWYYGQGENQNNWSRMKNKSVLGSGYIYNRTIQGVMSEVILYDGALDSVSRQKIESYLALKYGITLTPGTLAGRFDYVFSDGVMLWNGTAGGSKWDTYYNRVAAVIRDDASNLHNRQSHSTNVGSILHMGIAGTRLGTRADVGDFLYDTEAVIWGDDGDITGVTSVDLNDGCGDFEEVFNRTWLVHKVTEGNRPVSMIVGAQNNLGNQLGNDSNTVTLFNRLAESYSVYMIVADDPAKLTAENLPNGYFKAIVPMQYIDGEQQCSYTFTDSITYITFGCKANGACAGTAVFEGTKTFDWSQWTRQTYGTTINEPSIVDKPRVDLGDGVEVWTTAQYGNGVIAPANYPSVTNSPVAGSLYIQRREGLFDDSKVKVNLYTSTPVRPEFSIYDIDGYAGRFEKITITGFCGNDAILPVLSYAGNPTTSFYKISANVATAFVRNDLLPTNKNGQLNVVFNEGVTQVLIEYAITNEHQITSTHNLIISPVSFRSVPPMPLINEDGLSFVKGVNKDQLTTCQQPVEYSFYIGNVNCEAKYVSLKDTLPEGLTWIAGVGMDSTDYSHLHFNSYEGTTILHVDSLQVPGTGTLRVTASVAIDVNVVQPGDIKLFNNHAWIDYHQIVDSDPLPRRLKSVDRDNPLVGETQFIAIGVAPLDTVKTSITTNVEKYSADNTITVTVTINNPNTDVIPDTWLDVTFDAGFTYAGGFSSTGITPQPVTETQIGDSLLSIAGNTNAEGFTIPGNGVLTSFTFKLKAPTLPNLVTIKDENDEEIISPLKIEYIFTTLTNDLCLLSSTENMSGILEIPYQSLIANDDYAATISEITVIIPILDNDSLPANCTPEIEIIVPQQNGSVNIVSDTVYYTSNAGYAGFDSLEYQISCNGDTATAKVYIYVAEMPDNIDDAECYVTPPAMTWGIEVDWRSTETDLIVHVLPLVGDLNGDSIPEIVCFSDAGRINPLANGIPGVKTLAIYDSRTRSRIKTITLPAYVSEWDAGSYGLVRTPDKGALIVVATSDFKIYAYDIDGNKVWETQAGEEYGSVVGDYAVTLSFADFNQDGYPEVYLRDKIYNASTGRLLATATGGANKGLSWGDYTHSSNWKLSVPIAADVTGDSRLELILGNEIYDVNITNTTGTVDNSVTMIKTISPPTATPAVPTDGHAQVADFDLDGHLDIFISNRTAAAHTATVYGYVWNVFNNTVSAPFSIATSFSGKSIPLIADVDTCGTPEVIIQCGVNGTPRRSYKCFKYNSAGTGSFSQLWDFLPNEDTYSNSLTMFDFNQDGNNEVLMTDHYGLRILQGIIGVEITSQLFGAGTAMQYPIIADINADGSARIVSIGINNSSSTTVLGSLNIFKSSTTPWAPARKVWNQYMYNSVNVNEDLTVPRYPINPATVFPGNDGILGTSDDVRPYNNFLQQQTALNTKGTPLWLTPDAKFAETPVFNYYGDGDSIVISMNLTNIGEAGLQAPFYVSAYKNTVSSGNKIATDSSMTTLKVNDTLPVTVTIRNLSSYLPLDKIIIRINDRGSAAFVQTECDYSNNEYEYPVDKLPMAFNDTASILYNTDTTIDVKGNDQIPDDCSAVVPSYTNPVNGSITLVGDKIKYTPSPDFYGVDSLIYTLTCTSDDTVSKTEAKLYIIVSKPISDSYIACSGDSVMAGFEHIADVEYHWFEAETGGVSIHTGDTRKCAAPSDLWVEVSYGGHILPPRFNVVVNAHPLPIVALNFTAMCIGTSATLPLPSTGIWHTDSTHITSMNGNVITGISSGKATFVFTDDVTGCSTGIFTIAVDSFPTANEITGTPVVCVGQSVELSNTTPNGYWTTNSANIAIINTTANTATVRGDSEGKYYVTYRVDNGVVCQTKRTFLLKVIPNTPPEIIIGVER